MSLEYYQLPKKIKLDKGERICCIAEAPEAILNKVKDLARAVVLDDSPLIVVISQANYDDVKAMIKVEKLAVLSGETVTNVCAPKKALDEIASKARQVIKRDGNHLSAVINEKLYNMLCVKHHISNGLCL